MVVLMQTGTGTGMADLSSPPTPMGAATNVICGIHCNAVAKLDRVSIRVQPSFGERQ